MTFHRSFAYGLAAFAVATTLTVDDARAVPTLPAGFISLPIGGSFANPTGLAILGPSKLLVCEKRGTVWYLDQDLKKNQVLDLQQEALDNGDRGLLGVAVDPDFTLASGGWLYLLLIVDPNQDFVDNEQFSFGRLVRYQVALDGGGNLVANPLSRQVLIGLNWSDGIPSCHLSHSVGNLKFLADKSLVLTTGDGAHYDLTDAGGFDAPCFGAGKFTNDQDVGAFRSVYLNTLAGKVLRIDRNTGLGLPDNPFFTGNPSDIRSRVYAAGLRNPYRFTTLPSTSGNQKLMISDVGWNTWEELNLCAGGENFGWPCFEGTPAQGSYTSADPGGFCGSFTHAPPILAWHHSSNSTVGFKGNCTSGVVFYDQTQFPPLYRNLLFHCDYGASWMRATRLDSSGHYVSSSAFGTGMGSPTALELDTSSGELVLAALENGGTVRRIRYVGNDDPPTVKLEATPTFGPAPLTVQFKGSGSTAALGSLTYSWKFGDGTTSTQADPSKTYGSIGAFTAELTVTDSFGFASTGSILVTPGNTPPTIVNVRFPKYGKKYKANDTIQLLGTATDLEDGQAQVPLDMSWHIDLIHEDHVHPDFAVVAGASGSFVAQPHGDASYYLCRFVVRDSFGLTSEQAVPIYDVNSPPAPEIEEISDTTPRLGMPIEVTTKIFAPGIGVNDWKPSLSIDFGDGSFPIAFSGLADEEEKTVSHTYAALGTYTIKVRASQGNKSSEATAQVTVIEPKPAVAIFTPLLNQKWIPWDQQNQIAQQLTSTVGAYAGGTEVVRFSSIDQNDLITWMTPYMDDGVRDVIVVMDYCPSALFAGQVDDSPAELWLEHGNGIIWTGYQPFFSYVDTAGVVYSFFAGPYGADSVFDVGLLTFLSNGSGPQTLKPLASVDVPTLAAYNAGKAFRYTKLTGAWSIDRLYSESSGFESDALAVKHTSGGFYAEFYCVDSVQPRAAVIAEFLRAYVTGP